MEFVKTMSIGGLVIAEDSPVFVIAEAGVNHGGDMAAAKKMVDIAATAGADAVKFQTFKTEQLILQGVQKAPYQQARTGCQESQYDMLKKLEITRQQNLELKDYCQKKEIIFLTTPFDEASLEELEGLDLPAYKIASTDLTNLPFLEKIAEKNKPIFLSTGMSYLSEVELALKTIHPLNQQVVLLQCSANYPIQDEDANLKVIDTYRRHFNILLGYSDHSVGVGAAPYAIPMGVKIVEKHFTLDKNLSGPDHQASLGPDELKEFVQTVRRVESYLGAGLKYPSLAETSTRAALQKYLVAKRNIKKGEPFNRDNLIGKRTGGKGISPLYLQSLLGTLASRDFSRDEVIEL